MGPPTLHLMRVIRAALSRYCVVLYRGLSEAALVVDGGRKSEAHRPETDRSLKFLRAQVLRGSVPGASSAAMQLFVMYPQF